MSKQKNRKHMYFNYLFIGVDTEHENITLILLVGILLELFQSEIELKTSNVIKLF